MFIPKSIEGESFTLNALGKLNGGKAYEYINPKVREQLGDIPVEEAHWVLMTKDVLGEKERGPKGSRGKDYPTQEKMVAELAERSGEAYTVPQTLEAVPVLIANLLKSGGGDIFGRGNGLWTYTRCQEEVCDEYGVWHVSVGGLAPSGLDICHNYDCDNSGVAGLRKFFLVSR